MKAEYERKIAELKDLYEKDGADSDKSISNGI
jgi:hypothetical protein